MERFPLTITVEYEDKSVLRKELEADVEAFLERGGKVTQVASCRNLEDIKNRLLRRRNPAKADAHTLFTIRHS